MIFNNNIRHKIYIYCAAILICLFYPDRAISVNQEKINPMEINSNVKPYPDLRWEPQEYIIQPDHNTRYIDYNNGDDCNPGTRDNPWKHHPWDKNARCNAASNQGIYSYCFKNGVIYRGALIAKESGLDDRPIFLYSDPQWGIGKASIYGSIRINDEWMRCDGDECPAIPAAEREKAWYIDLDQGFVPRMLWEIYDGKVIRIPIARTPNWKITDPDDPRSEWWELTDSIIEVKIYLNNTHGFKVGDIITGTGKWIDRDENKDNIRHGNNSVSEVTKNYIKIESWKWKKGEIKAGAQITNSMVKAKVLKISGTHDVVSRLVDDRHLVQNNPEYYVGATIWAEKESMPKPDAEKVIGFDPIEHSLRVKYHRGVKGQRKYDRYYLENLFKFLDSPCEFYYDQQDKNSGRLFLRLPKNRNPNFSIIEAARKYNLIEINNKKNITISGLDLRFSNAIDCGTREARHSSLHTTAIRIMGNCTNIKILNSEISNVPTGIIAWPEKKGDLLDYIEISDNDIHDIDSAAIGLSNGRSHYRLKDAGARLIHVDVLRNRIRNTGYRVLSQWGLGPHAVHIEGGELVEIAGNVVDVTGGAGLFAFNGSEYSKGGVERPLMRTLIHHNKVTNSLLGMQDYGGIASWKGGPSYVYCNISGNPVGYKHAHYRRLKKKNWYRTSCYGVGIYLDAQYKGYIFNNIIWGKNNNVNDRYYNSAAFNEAAGFMNTIFNNTMYCFGVGLHKGMTQHNRCYYLGNLMLDIGHKFIQQEPKSSIIEYHSLGYANNIFKGDSPNFGQLGRKVYASLDKWEKALEAKQVMVTQTGRFTKKPQVVNERDHDFRLKSDSIAIDNGVKVFVPWGLYAVVGEWNFFRHPADPSVILGENMNWNSEWLHGNMFQDIPRNNLRTHNIGRSNFYHGILEDWIKGALSLNGKNQYCEISNDLLKKGYRWSTIKCKKKPCQGYYDGKKRVTVDMDINNFLIEVILKTANDFIDGGVVCKRSDRGYTFAVDKSGYIKLMLDFGGSECSRASAFAINDSKWHHIIAEVDRTRPHGINIYVDGNLSNGQWQGFMNNSESLSNDANFMVGKTLGPTEKFFKGLIDFLRISRGTLEDAETTIEELYKWEFDGPFLRDFYGKPPKGVSRDAGALEYFGVN